MCETMPCLNIWNSSFVGSSPFRSKYATSRNEQFAARSSIRYPRCISNLGCGGCGGCGGGGCGCGCGWGVGGKYLDRTTQFVVRTKKKTENN